MLAMPKSKSKSTKSDLIKPPGTPMRVAATLETAPGAGSSEECQSTEENGKKLDNKPADKNTCVDCDLCCKHIVEGREEALQCEGGCGLWFHRYCAGVSTSYFQELANSPAPFVCFSCYQRLQKAITSQLQDEVSRLKAEIGSLRDKLNEMSNCEPAPVQRTWSTVVKSKRYQNRTATNTVHNHCDQKSAVAAKESHQSESRKQENTDSAARPQRSKVSTLVHGARRIWGTLRACSATAVKNAIQTLSKSKPHLHVKRKTKVVQGREIWWFVLHGEEAVLKNLDAEWEMIAIQTNWKIEPCFKTCPHETATDASSQNDSEVKTVTTVNHLHEHSTTDAANAFQLKDAQNDLSDSGPISDHAAASTSTTSPIGKCL